MYQRWCLMSAKRIVGLAGHIGSGKGEIAQILERLGYVRLKFAQPLRDMLHAIGLTKQHTDGALKEVPCDLLAGRTPRWAMQSLGTEWGRELIHPDIWILLWKARAAEYDRIVVDDVRFPNEAAAIHELGGVVWLVFRSGLLMADHESEYHIDSLPTDSSINNCGSLEYLADMVELATRVTR